ncbi:MAG: lipid-binding SYLF domain-containing protein [Gammaproteobacteria bacterium]|nr:lipid-binding SYLF domain-containing protein [Gammaproteobacteria bacterium]NIR85763.1 lipid-binding SYLF domain-containing protein [Gammaproteobacteria bacterium]NIR90296.1 lipid-binding SYLF domain-containing protein [Gammaproteobacteria bacterium]NIU06897.1 lipid-binding SYLF domain-containing protein [Gammaproteobacteria bacterium]NIV53830.1 hypothetical protein [Gammaproteobacteria bacterium]
MAATLFAVSHASAREEAKNARETVESARKTFENFAADPNMGWFRDHVKDAHAVLIVPQLLKAGFIFGGSGGTGVLLAKDANGRWSYPAFYSMGSVTWGLQIGAEVAEVVMLVMTKNGIDSFLSTKVQLGGDVSVAVGPVGAGGQAATADIIQFSRTKGVFGGLTLEGAVIGIRDSLNHAYYEHEVRPRDILVRRDVSNAHAQSLIETVAKVAAGQ